MVTALFCLIYWLQPLFLTFLELKVYDSFLRLRKEPNSTGIVTIVAIDEKSLETLGQWPWPRYLVARLIDKLKQMGSIAIGVDIIFAEPDRTSIGRIKQEMSKEFGLKMNITGIETRYYDNDLILAHSIKDSKVVLGYQFLFDNTTTNKACSIKPLDVFIKMSEGATSNLIEPVNILCPVDTLLKHSQDAGFINIGPDIDGIVRTAPIIMRYKDNIYPNLSLSTLLSAADISQIVLSLKKTDEAILFLDDTAIPLIKGSKMLIPYKGPSGSFINISASDIIKETVSLEDIRGKIVLIGATAAGLKDLRATPFDPTMAGVEIHANIIDSILRSDFIIRPSYAFSVEMCFVIILGLFSTFLIAYLRALWCIGIVFITSLLICVLSFLYFSKGIYISPFYPLLTYVSNLSLLSFVRVRMEENRVRERNKQIVLTQTAAIEAIANITETRDPETGGHIKRTKEYVRILSRTLKKNPKYKHILDDEYIQLLYLSAPMHDIGKVGIPDRILLKPGRFNDEEFEIMKKHTIYGKKVIDSAEQILGENSFLKLAREIAYSHQEKWDGSGYPQGLKGEEIPLSARIMGLVDVYDALVCKRVYKKGLSHKMAVEIIRSGRGSHFDPDIVDAFIEVHERFLEIALAYADSEEERLSLLDESI
ncbi:MAG: CHASE2 domain-containing protein [Thermodesulfovibrionales bacterium]|nr:CHASE2 domain-containing protein [Thermodesulfovibrionales bacterium]